MVFVGSFQNLKSKPPAHFGALRRVGKALAFIGETIPLSLLFGHGGVVADNSWLIIHCVNFSVSTINIPSTSRKGTVRELFFLTYIFIPRIVDYPNSNLVGEQICVSFIFVDGIKPADQMIIESVRSDLDSSGYCRTSVSAWICGIQGIRFDVAPNIVEPISLKFFHMTLQKLRNTIGHDQALSAIQGYVDEWSRTIPVMISKILDNYSRAPHNMNKGEWLDVLVFHTKHL